jgi:hypothetical protein
VAAFFLLTIRTWATIFIAGHYRASDVNHGAGRRHVSVSLNVALSDVSNSLFGHVYFFPSLLGGGGAGGVTRDFTATGDGGGT